MDMMPGPKEAYEIYLKGMERSSHPPSQENRTPPADREKLKALLLQWKNYATEPHERYEAARGIVDMLPSLLADVERAERERDQARKAILDYGKGVDFDWDVLEQIDNVIPQLRARAERMEKALREIAENASCDCDGGYCQTCIARAALAEGEANV